MTKIQNKIIITCLLAVLIVLIGAVFCSSTTFAEEDVLTASTSFVILYHANGGQTNSGFTSYYIYNGEEYTVQSSSTVSREGYTFGGWYDNKEGTGSQYTTFPANYEASGNITLYAKWIANTYNVNYYVPGLDAISVLAYTDTYTTNSYYVFKDSIFDNYAFLGHNVATLLGWYDNPELSGDPITAINKPIYGDKNVYAKWEYKTYTITYHDVENGSYDNWALPLKTSYTYGELLEYSSNSTDYYFVIPTKASIVAKGWYDNSNFTGSTVNSLLRYVVDIKQGIPCNIDLYALWDYARYSITYVDDKNGSYDNWAIPLMSSYSYLDVKDYADNNSDYYFVTPNKAYYICDGWYDNSNYEGNSVTSLVNYVQNNGYKNIVLYAKWTAITYYVNYVIPDASGNNSTAILDSPEVYNVETGYTVRDEIFDKSFGGHAMVATLLGWYDNAEYVGDSITSFAIGTTGNLTVYAKWEYTQYTITYYDPKNGSYDNWALPLKSSYTYKDYIDYVNSDTNYIFILPNKAGMVCDGWYDNSNYEGNIVNNFRDYLESKNFSIGDITLFAKWNLFEYAVNFYLPNSTGAIEQATIAPNQVYTVESGYDIDDNIFYIYAFGGNTISYRLLGWYDNAECSGEPITQIEIGEIGVRDLYAKYELITYTIYFNANGGYHVDNWSFSDTLIYGQEYIIRLSEPAIKKDKYRLKGWYIDSDCTQPITSISADNDHDITVYAGWTRCTVDLHVYIDKTLEKLLQSDWDSDIRKYDSYYLEINDYSLYGKGITLDSTLGQAINNKQTAEDWLAPTIKDKILYDMENAYCNAYEIELNIGDTINIDVYDMVFYNLDFSEELSEDTVLADVEEGVNVVISRNKISVKFVFVDCDYESIIGQLGSRYDVVYEYATTPGTKLQFPEETYSTYTVYMGMSIINQYDVYFVGWTLEYCNWQHWLGGNVIGIPESENVKHELVSQDYIVNEDTTLYAYCSFKSVNLNPGADEGATEGKPNPYATCTCGWCKLLNSLGINAVSFRKLVHLEDKSLANIFATFWGETWFKVMVIILSIIALALVYPIIRLVIVVIAFPIKLIYRASSKASKTLKKKQQRRR